MVTLFIVLTGVFSIIMLGLLVAKLMIDRKAAENMIASNKNEE